MVVIMNKSASQEQVEAVITNLNAFGFDVHQSSGVNQVVLGAIGVRPGFDHTIIRGLSGVANVQRVTEPYKLASRAGREESTVVNIDGVEVGGGEITIMAGLRSTESEEEINAAANLAETSGASLLQGNVHHPRTSLYDHNLLDSSGLNMIRKAVDSRKLKLVMEVSSTGLLDTIAQYADLLLIGARNMQNFELLRAVGESGQPVMLERGVAATIEEWLMAAEYIMRSGNTQIILCESGIRTFERATRLTLDLSGVSVVKAKSHLPIFVDPSQGAGIRDHVIPLARAAVATGADGLVVDVHHHPSDASANGLQALNFEQFKDLIQQVGNVANAVGRGLN